MAKAEDQMLIVVGASAGGMEALKELVAQFPSDLPAPVLIVNHMSPDMTGDVLVRALDEAGALHCQHGTDGARFESGNIYVAPSDRHMLIKGRKLLVTKGARENRSRPAIDPLFRSAAVAHGNRVIGVILTGYLDDGTSGMMAIKRCGGICVAQDPDDAPHPDMPRSVIVNVGVDHCLPIASMGALLSELAHSRPERSKPAPDDVVIEARIAQRVLSDLPSVEWLGDLVNHHELTNMNCLIGVLMTRSRIPIDNRHQIAATSLGLSVRSMAKTGPTRKWYTVNRHDP